MSEFNFIDLRDHIPDDSYFESNDKYLSLYKRANILSMRVIQQSFQDPGSLIWENEWGVGPGHAQGASKSRMDYVAHPDPAIRRIAYSGLLMKRRRVYRAHQVWSTIDTLDLVNDPAHVRWLAALEMHGDWAYLNATHRNHVHIWDIHSDYRVPEGIPDHTLEETGHPSLLPPETSNHDIESAAIFELEASLGGLASLLMPVHLGNTAAVKSTKIRVARYLKYNLQFPPWNPWDANHWGHDARLRSVKITDAQGRALDISPRFDPDVFEYKSSRASGALRVVAFPMDRWAVVTTDVTGPRVQIRVESTSGSAHKTYRFNQVNN